jgi:hypothetical protein
MPFRRKSRTSRQSQRRGCAPPWLICNVGQKMKTILSVLAVLIPFVLQGVILKIPLGEGTQRALFVLCPIAGLLASVSFASTRKSGKWFYAIVAILYGVVLFFSVAVLNWKQT